MSKAVFIDVDGTLVDYQNNLPESAVYAIREARKNGHKIYICTGRSKAEVYSPIWNIGLDGMIGGNGSYVEDNGEVILHQMLSSEEEKAIVDWLHENGLEFYLESNNGLFASELFKEKGQKAVQEYSRRKGQKASEFMTVEKAFPDMIYNADLYRDDVNKISYVLNSYDDFLKTKEAFPELKNNTWGGEGEIALFGDIGVKDITKAEAISKLLKHLNMEQKDTIAFGDAKIDIPMFEFCNMSVAMGSGGDEAKEAADFITDAVDQDGLYNAFVKLDLIEDTL